MQYKRHIAIRLIALFLAVFAFSVFCCGPLCQSANAIAVVDDAFIAVLIAAIAACGITIITTGAFENSRDYIESLFNEYCYQAGYSSPDAAVYGVNYGKSSSGKLLLNNRFLILISSFMYYVKTKFSLTDNVQYNIRSKGDFLGSYQCYELPVSFVRYGNQSVEFITYQSNLPVYVFNVGTMPVFVSEWNAYVRCTNNRQGGDAIYNTLKRQGYVSQINRGYVENPQIFWVLATDYDFSFTSITQGDNPPQYTPEMIAQAIENFDSIQSVSGIKLKTGEIVLPVDDDRYTPGDGAILDVGGTWGETIGEILTETIPEIFSEGKEGDTEITYEEEGTVEEQIEETVEQMVSSDPGDYAVSGLEQVFPFCIPFDIYNFVSALDAAPEAPVINWRFYVPGICDETITIDLSVYNNVAALLRTMELLLFCVGLAFVTRKIIRG